jgi:hypothetical protein
MRGVSRGMGCFSTRQISNGRVRNSVRLEMSLPLFALKLWLTHEYDLGSCFPLMHESSSRLKSECVLTVVLHHAFP